jgi:hypothetical protein
VPGVENSPSLLLSVNQGDTLILEEWDQETQGYTGRKIETVVTAVEKIAETPAGSMQEATEPGSLIIQFEPKPSKYTFVGEQEQK